MGKMYFIHGTMGSGKSLDLIRAAYNYKERGLNVLIYKPAIDTRSGERQVKSRTGLILDAKNYLGSTQIQEDITNIQPAAIFFDEAQFLKEKDIDELQKICYNLDIPILFYGLKVDYQSHLFPASRRLIEVADEVRECIGICSCGKRAKQNMRLLNGKPVFEGEQIQVGGNESYIAVCNHCYKKAKGE